MWDLSTIIARNDAAANLERSSGTIRPSQVWIGRDKKRQEANFSDQRVSALKAELSERDLVVLEGSPSLS